MVNICGRNRVSIMNPVALIISTPLALIVGRWWYLEFDYKKELETNVRIKKTKRWTLDSVKLSYEVQK